MACDLDGTLLTSDEVVSERTIATIKRLRAEGVRVIASTGRGPLTTQPVLVGLGIADFAVCSNGAVVFDIEKNEFIERHAIDGPTALRIMTDVREGLPDVCFGWEDERGFGWDDAFANYATRLMDVAPQVDFDPERGVTKLIAAHPTVVCEELMSRVDELSSLGVEASSGGGDLVVVTAAGIDKATGIERLASKWNITAEQVVVFGDSWNDIPMLRWAGIGVAMGNADDAAKEAADDVAGHHDDDGVAEYLERLFNLD